MSVQVGRHTILYRGYRQGMPRSVSRSVPAVKLLGLRDDVTRKRRGAVRGDVVVYKSVGARREPVRAPRSPRESCVVIWVVVLGIGRQVWLQENAQTGARPQAEVDVIVSYELGRIESTYFPPRPFDFLNGRGCVLACVCIRIWVSG